MPPSGSALGALIQTTVDGYMGAIAGHHPLAQPNPTYFVTLCNAIGQGIIAGGPTINFTTSDTGLQGTPLVTGTGSGVGIVVDVSFTKPQLYTKIRSFVLADFGQTRQDPYPPGPTNTGQYLKALSDGIADAIHTYYLTAWTLTSTHPDIYSGTGLINDGQFSGLSSSAIKSSIVGFAPGFVGVFWPRLAQAVAEVYVDSIQLHSTGTVTITGTCIPSITQVCGISGSGTGTGVAS